MNDNSYLLAGQASERDAARIADAIAARRGKAALIDR